MLRNTTQPEKTIKLPAPDALKNGDTLLHWAVCYYANADQLQAFINYLGRRVAAQMAKTVNNNGNMPFDLVIGDQASEIYQLLRPLTISNTLPKFSDTVSFKDVCDRYSPTPDSELYKNLQLACKVANMTRKMITMSATHPDVNEANKFKTFIDEIENHRAKTDFNRSLLFSYSHNDQSLSDESARWQKLVTNQIRLYQTYHMGNCHEMSWIAFSLLAQESEFISAMIYSIRKGDHVFLAILDKNSSSLPSQPNKSNASVICDPWAGKVYPAYDLVSQLGCYRLLAELDNRDQTLLTNITYAYNPDYHQITPCSTFSSIDRFRHGSSYTPPERYLPNNSTLARCGFFAASLALAGAVATQTSLFQRYYSP